MLAEAIGARPFAVHTPVVDGRDRDAELLGEFRQTDEGLETPRALVAGVVHARRYAGRLRPISVATGAVGFLPDEMRGSGPRDGVSDDVRDDLAKSFNLQSPGNP